MVKSKEIFQRATMRGLAEHLLYGVTVPCEESDYDKRIDKAFEKFDCKTHGLAGKNASEICDYASELVRETTDLYVEIGVQSGMLMMMDLMKKAEQNTVSNEGDVNYKEMYYLLFTGISDALNKLAENSDNRSVEASCILKEIQCKAEEIYIKNKE